MESIFLACFVFGALFTVASVVLGFAGHGAAHIGHSLGHLGGNGGAAHIGHGGAAHIGHGGATDVGQGGAAHVGHGHIGHDAATAGHSHGVHGEVPHSENTTLPWLNASSAVGALTWFGGGWHVL